MREGWSRHEWYAELHEEVKAADELARHRAASKKRREGSVRCASCPCSACVRPRHRVISLIDGHLFYRRPPCEMICRVHLGAVCDPGCRYKSGAGGHKTREALLDFKSHRRVSRRQVCWQGLPSSSLV